jgi:iron complex outermembrane recepter protein
MRTVGFGILLCLLCLGHAASAQADKHCDHVLFGVVTDSETMEPLPYAKIQIQGTTRGVITGLNGEYRLTELCDGDMNLVITHIGCDEQVLTVTVRENTHYDIQLAHHLSHLDTITISDRHADPRALQGEAALEGKMLARTRGKTLGEALKDIAGVNALQTGPSIFKPMIHGLHSNRVLILNNGVRQEGQQWGTEHGPEIDPFIATRITVLKGASGVRFGSDAIAGVVLVEPAALPDSAGIGGAVHLVGMSNGRLGAASAHLEGAFARLPGLAWRAQGTFRQSGSLHAPTYILSNTAFKEYNFSYALGWNRKRYAVEAYYSQFNTDLGIFAGAHIGNLTDLQAAIGRPEPLIQDPFTYEIGRPSQHVEHELVKVNARYELGELGRFRLQVSRQYNLRQEYDITRRNLTRPSLHYEVTTHGGELLWEHDKWHHIKGQGGVSASLQQNTYEGAFFIPDYVAHNYGVFWIERFVLTRLELEAGLRYDLRDLSVFLYEPQGVRNLQHNWRNLSGTIGGLYRISHHLSATLQAGTAWRPPAVNELYSKGLHHGAASVEFGDASLAKEQVLSFNAGIRYGGHERLSGELSLYHNRFDGFIYLQPVQPPTLTIRGAFPTFEYRQADAVLTGADLSAAWSPLHRLRWDIKASVLRARNRSTDNYLILMPADRLENMLSYNFADIGRLQAPVLSAGIVQVRHQNRVPAGEDYLAPPPGYFLLNAEASAGLRIGAQPLQIGLSVHNLLNTRYRDYLDRFRYYADAIGRNVTLRISYPFHFQGTKHKNGI